MEPTASREPPGRVLLPRQRSSPGWLLPSVVVHLVLLIAALTAGSRPRAAVERPLPPWALALRPPQVIEQGYPDMPPAPAALRLPSLARPVERAPAEAPAPAEPSAEGMAAATPADSAGAAPAPGGAPSTGPIGPVRPRLPVAERLRPGNGDPRLWARLPEEIARLSPEQIAQFEIDLAVAEVLDSIDAAEAAGRRATDWTYTDAQGRRWGVSPGQIHLGGITIPLPFGFSAPRTAEALRRASQDADIAAHAGRAEASAALRDRAAEIRRRRDAERAQERLQQSRPRADTTGGNR